MFYRFNSLAGRLVGSGQLQSYLPQGLKPAGPEGTKIIYAFGTHFSKVENFKQSPGDDQYGEVPERIRKLQQQFQVDDGTPVHLKGGTNDRILFGVTCLVAAVGLFECFRLYYTLAFPKKPE